MKFSTAVLLCTFATFCNAQATTDAALLQEVRGKYDAPFNRDLQSFACAVDFSWKQHFAETTRVGDEGTDEELRDIFQPIRNRVLVTGQSVTVSAGLTDDAISKLPHGGMPELLLQHAVKKSLESWLPAGTNTMLPESATPASFERSAAGYKMSFAMQGADIDMMLAPDMRLQGATLKAPQAEHFDTTFLPGPQGFLLGSWNIGEDGNSEPGHRLIFTYTYQTVDGFRLPEQVVVNRESHHEVWRYKLSGCLVKKK